MVWVRLCGVVCGAHRSFCKQLRAEGRSRSSSANRWSAAGSGVFARLWSGGKMTTLDCNAWVATMEPGGDRMVTSAVG